MITKLFVATKAFILYKDKVLIIKESGNYSDGTNVSKFDLVGGRVIPGERFNEGLIREVKEETSLNINIGNPFFVDEWRPIVKDEQWQIVATFFECTTEFNEVILSKDHNEFLWINPEDYKKYPLIENLYPVFESYLSKKKI